MQTRFSPAQLASPETARAERALRKCVHCGFCTATCPSYQVLGDELDSPRGRIYLIREMLESGRPADAATVKHLDRCLGCFACKTTCPSGVDYMHLIDAGRAHVDHTFRRPPLDRALRWLLARVLPYPGRMRAAMAAAKLARPLRRLVPEPRLRALLDLARAPIAAPRRHDDPQIHPAEAPRRLRVALMTGCAQKALDADINAATIRLLTRLGCEVAILPGMGCCGALVHHMGRGDEARAQAAANVRVLAQEIDGPGLDAVVINTSGCGTTVKEYGVLLEETPLAADAARVAALAKDVTEVLAGLDLGARVTGQTPSLTVAYHAACSLQHGQRVRQAPGDLLRAAGFRVVTPPDAHLCCGSAGTYNIMHPEISAALQSRKVDALSSLDPDVVAAGNIGCMVQISAGCDLPVLHTAELLDWATGGPRPAKLGAV